MLTPQHPESFGDARYLEVKPIPTYKKGIELLWLEVSCNGDLASYKKEFLKSDKDDTFFKIEKKMFLRGKDKSVFKNVEGRRRNGRNY